MSFFIKISRKILLICLCFSLYKADCAEFIIVKSRPDGMFSIFQDVLAVLQSYDNHLIQGMAVDFDCEGAYFDPLHGKNWWEYYFEPIFLGTHDSANIITTYYHDSWKIEYCNSRSYNYNLINKYIHVKSHINDKVASFVRDNFQDNFIIGVHYRGTDKMIEAPRVAYEEILTAINFQISKLQDKEYRIFLATDEVSFVDWLSFQFPGLVCYHDAARSTNHLSVHHNPQRNHYQCGEEALIDCILLSKTDLLIRTDSNLSLCASFFNPDIPIIKLNKSFWSTR